MMESLVAAALSVVGVLLVSARYFDSRSVAFTSAVDTGASMAIRADSTSAGAIDVPPGMTKIVSVDIHYCDDSAALGRTVAEVVLSGTGVPTGPHSFLNPGGGNQLITGAGHQGVTAHYECEVPATATGKITATAYIHGTDTGSQAIGVTLGFA